MVAKMFAFICLLILMTHAHLASTNMCANKLALLGDFFKLKGSNKIIIAGCDSDFHYVNAWKSLSSKGYSVNIYKLSIQDRIFLDSLINDFKLGIVLDMSCEHSESFVKNVSLLSGYPRIFSQNYHWLLFGNNITANTIDLFSNLAIDIDTELIYAVPSGEKSFQLYDVYNTGKNNFGKLTLKKYGYWKHGIKFENISKQFKYLQRSNMTGVILKCMIVVTKTLHERLIDYISTPYETHIDSMNRFNFALLLHLKDIYNFRYEMTRTNSWGYLNNGTFDGMIGQLERRLIDIGGSPIFFRIERARVVDYTIQTWVSRPCFIFRHPKKISILKIYTRPLEVHVWYCGIGFVSLSIILLYILQRYQKKNRSTHQDDAWCYNFLLTIGILFQQGLPNNLYTLSGKIAIITICLFSILFYQFYSASIVSSLLMEPPKTIKTLEDLSNSNLKAGIEDILYNIDYFARTNDPIALKIYRQKIMHSNKKNYFHPTDGLTKVKKGGFAFHVDIATAYKIIRETFSEQEICDLSEIQLFPPQRMMAIVQKQSPFRKLITFGLRKISEVGLMARQKSVWHEKKPPCIRNANTDQFKVSFKNASSAMVFLLSGMLISTILLVIEIQLKKYYK